MQAEKFIDEYGLDAPNINPMATPGVKCGFQEYESNTPLDPHLHTPFRSTAARANFLFANRIDLMFAVKEVCR